MLNILREELQQFVIPAHEQKAVFFKTGPGDYAEHDQFLGVPVPQLRKIAKKHAHLALETVIELLQSTFNEERTLALLLLVQRYQKGDSTSKEHIFQLYQTHIKQVNNWNLVDVSAHLIVGAHLYQRDKQYLMHLAQSESLWERRIAIVSTWYFIRNNDCEWTIKLAELMLHDKQDLIHKAVGWMLREAGKHNEPLLVAFLEQHAHSMPRVMLRYAIERFSVEQRRIYLAFK
jgi:3-methyladenine DNA glycosylase AlkD